MSAENYKIVESVFLGREKGYKDKVRHSGADGDYAAQVYMSMKARRPKGNALRMFKGDVLLREVVPTSWRGGKPRGYL